jgi:hypothetical protein
MRLDTRVRAAFTGGAALLILALSGVLAAAAEAAPAVLSSGKTSGYPADATASTMGAAVIVTIVAIVVTAGVIAWAAFGLDRRGRTQLQVVEGSGESTPARSEDERRKAA